MIWLTWRQFRTQFAVVFGVLAVTAVALAFTGPNLVHLYDNAVAACAKSGDCATAPDQLLGTDLFLQLTSVVLLVLPALVGIFWGAPLVARELETQTHKLAWTQSITRTRWLAGRVGVVGLASVAVAGLFSLMVTWWWSPLDRAATLNNLGAGPFSPSLFDRRDIVPIAYTLFAFALGLAAGVLIRRTLPAMAITLVAFVSVRYAVEDWVRPHLMGPLRLVTAYDAGPDNGSPSFGRLDPRDWVISNETINRAGEVIGQNGGFGAGTVGVNVSTDGTVSIPGAGVCPKAVAPPQLGPGGHAPFGPPSGAFNQGVQECADKLGLRQVLTYQPIDRYWPFQWYESALFAVLALALLGISFWWVRRRLS